MNSDIKLVHNAMLDNQIAGFPRSQPVASLRQDETHSALDQLQDALLEYGKSIGYDITIHSVERRLVPKAETVNLALAKMRYAVYHTICVHGMATTNDALLKGLLPEPATHVQLPTD